MATAYWSNKCNSECVFECIEDYGREHGADKGVPNAFTTGSIVCVHTGKAGKGNNTHTGIQREPRASADPDNILNHK